MANGNKKTIVLVDDHVIIRNGLKELIEKLGNYTVSAQFDSGPAFLNSLQAGLYPDLLVLDISMPGMNGDAVLEAMGQAQVSIPSLVLTLDDNDSTVIRMFRLGARGYLRKNCSATELRDAIQSIFSHGYYHNEFLAYSLRTNSAPVKKTERELILEQLTPREKEFLKLVCHEKEYTYKQIADKMHIEPRTVDGYRENIFEKFGIKSKTGLVLFVLKHQLSDVL